MHLCDEIIVIHKGEMVEYGTFQQLMAKKGFMAKLVSENVQILREPESHELKRQMSTGNSHSHSRHSHLPAISETTLKRSFRADVLTREQVHNREHLSRLNNMIATDENISMLIEANQILGNIGQPSLIREIQRSRLSIVSSATSIEEITPSDAEPMKLVLEDQSVNYKISPIWTYLKSGWGVIITLAIFAVFFLVNLVRVISGNFIFGSFYLFLMQILDFYLQLSKIIGSRFGSLVRQANTEIFRMQISSAPTEVP